MEYRDRLEQKLHEMKEYYKDCDIHSKITEGYFKGCDIRAVIMDDIAELIELYHCVVTINS